MKKKEMIFLILFITLFLLVGHSFVGKFKIAHDYPYGYRASDAFQHLTRAEAIKDIGNYKYEADYIMGGHSDVIGFYPPLNYHLVIIFSQIAGIELYDGFQILVKLFVLISCLLVYFLIKEYNLFIALLSLPISFFIFGDSIFYAFFWGHWPALFGLSFLVAIIWITYQYDKIKYWYIFLAIIMSGTILSHTSEAVFAILFLLVFFSIKLIKTRDMTLLKNLIFASIITGILSLYTLFIFINTWVLFQKPEVLSNWGENAIFSLTNFGWLLIPLILGVICAVILKKEIFIFPITFLIIGFGNFFYLGWRAYQLRFFWPILLSPLIGFGLIQIINLIPKLKLRELAVYLSVLVISFFLLIPSIKGQYYNLDGRVSLIDGEDWFVLNQLSQEMKKNESIFFFYSNAWGQDAVLRQTKHDHFLIDPYYVINKINPIIQIERYVMSEIPGDPSTRYPYKKSPFKFGYHFLEDGGDNNKNRFRDICNFDYYLIDFTEEPFNGYNLKFANIFYEHNLTFMYASEKYVVVKNVRKGEECIN